MDPKNVSLSFLNSVKKIIFQSRSINSFNKKLNSMKLGFLSQNLPFSHNVYYLCFSDLGKYTDIKELRQNCLTKTNQLINLIKSNFITESMEDKINENSLILPIGKISSQNIKKINKKYRLFNKTCNVKDIDTTFIDVGVISKQGPIVSRQLKTLIHNLNDLKIPVYLCSSIFNFDREKYKKNNVLEPNKIKGIISEMGIYSHEDFINTLQNEFPILFDFF